MKKQLLLKVYLLFVIQGTWFIGAKPLLVMFSLGYTSGYKNFFLEASNHSNVKKVVKDATKKVLKALPIFNSNGSTEIHRISILSSSKGASTDKNHTTYNFHEIIEYEDLWDFSILKSTITKEGLEAMKSKLLKKLEEDEIKIDDSIFAYPEEKLAIYFKNAKKPDLEGSGISIFDNSKNINSYYETLQGDFQNRHQNNFNDYIESFLKKDTNQSNDSNTQKKTELDKSTQTKNKKQFIEKLRKAGKIGGGIGILLVVVLGILYISIDSVKNYTNRVLFRGKGR